MFKTTDFNSDFQHNGQDQGIRFKGRSHII